MIQEPGQRSRWQIRSDADPAFLGARTQTLVPTGNLLNHSKKAREEALRRAAIVKRWKDRVAAGDAAGFSREESTEKFLDALRVEGVKICRPTLYNWAKKIDRAGSIEGAVDGRTTRSAVAALAKDADPFLDCVKRHYLDQKKPSLKTCFARAEGAAFEHGWVTCSYETAYRFIQSLDKTLVIRRREGESAFENDVIPFLKRDYSQLSTNEMWDSDHHIFDVMVKVGERLNRKTGELEPIYKRPWLTAWQDLRSRKIVGWKIQIENPNTWTIIEVLGDAIRVSGAPEWAYTDNGKDFDCSYLTGFTKMERRILQQGRRMIDTDKATIDGVAARLPEKSLAVWKKVKVHIDNDQAQLGGIYAGLQMKHKHAWPFHGQSKPIERFFGRVCAEFSKTFATYCGRNVVEKPEDLADKLAAGKGPTLEEFIAQFGDWVTYAFNAAPHQGDSMDDGTPDQVFAAHLTTRRVVGDDTLEWITRPRVGPVTMAQNGVSWKGIQYGAFEQKLYEYFGRKVYLRLGRYVNAVTVWTEDDKPICMARSNQLISPNAEQADLTAAIAEKKRITKIVRQNHEIRLRLYEDTTDATNRFAYQRAQLAAAAPHDAPPAPNIKLLRSNLEGASKAFENPASLPLKKAVGDDTPEPGGGGFSYRATSSEDAGVQGGFAYHHGGSDPLSGDDHGRH